MATVGAFSFSHITSQVSQHADHLLKKEFFLDSLLFDVRHVYLTICFFLSGCCCIFAFY